MSTASARTSLRGFTLLEIVLAVLILSMMSFAIYRFVTSNLIAVRLSGEQMSADERYDGLQALLTAQWQSISPGQGALLGEPLKMNDRSRDEITWLSPAGPGLLTRYAQGEYKVTLRLRPSPNQPDRMELGLFRRPRSAPEGSGEGSWVSLLDRVESVEIKYFDPRVNTWVTRWTDTIALPRLVRLVIGRTDTAKPWEGVIAIARTPL